MTGDPPSLRQKAKTSPPAHSTNATGKAGAPDLIRSPGLPSRYLQGITEKSLLKCLRELAAASTTAVEVVAEAIVIAATAAKDEDQDDDPSAATAAKTIVATHCVVPPFKLSIQ